MTQQEAAGRVSRRGMLTGLGAGAAAVGAGVLAVGAGTPAGAAPGDPVVQGADNDAGGAGTVLRSTASGATLEVRNSVGSVGVDATGFDAGAVGFSSNGNGIVGRSDIGYGVIGAAGGLGGVGVVAAAPDEFSKTALDVRGQVRFARSGVVTVPAGATSATVAGLQVYASTHALAVAQRSTSAWVKAAVPVQASGQLRVHLNTAAPAGGVPVAWWLLEI